MIQNSLSKKAYLIVNLLVVFCLFNTINVKAQDTKVQSQISVVDSSALTLINGIYGNIINGQNFQQSALISYKGWQYITFYNSARHVCVGRRQLPDGQWNIIDFAHYYFSFSKGGMNDSHNTISMGICKNDGTIHLAFDHHASPLHYRVSIKHLLDHPANFKWDTTAFCAIRNYLEDGKPLKDVTYPRFISTPKGDMLMGFRVGGSNDGDYYLHTYNGKMSTWSNKRQIMSGKGDYHDLFKGISTTRNAYLNSVTYDDKGKLHISWTWRERAEGLGNRDIGYAYSPDDGNTWYNNRNEVVTKIAENKVINTNSTGIVIKELDRGWGMMNSQSQAVDKNGVMHIVMYHRQQGGQPEWARFNKEGRYFHYYRNPGGTWHEDKLNYIGNRPKLIADSRNNLYLIYMRKDHFDSKTESAPLVVLKATAKSKWTDWAEFFVSPDNYFNEPQTDLSGNTLSVMVQDGPASMGALSALKVISINLK
jgi:hypothetical protein